MRASLIEEMILPFRKMNHLTKYVFSLELI